MDLKNRIINAGSWTLFGHITSQMIRLGSNLIMTRLLVPEMFGIMAIAYIIIVGLAMFSDLGLKQNIIQSKRGDDPLFLNTVWSVQIIRGAVLAVVCLLAAYTLTIINQFSLLSSDNVYSSSLLPQVLMFLAISPLLQGLESTKVACANRGLYLKRVVTLELTAQLFGLAFMLTWVYFDRSIWALVFGAIFSGFIKMILSHFMLPGYSNKLAWDHNAFNEVFHFGKWMFISSILGFLINQGDKLLLGGMMSTKSFGLYSIAALLYAALEGLISKLISNVAFPALGEVNRLNPQSVREKYYKIRVPVDIFCLFLAGFIFISGSTIVNILYDQRYDQSGHMFEILGLLLLVIRFGIAGQFYLVMGKPKIMTILIFSRLVFMLVFIPIGFKINQDMGAVWGLVLAYFPGLLLTFYFKKRYGLLDPKREFLVFPVFFIGLLAGYSFKWLFVQF